jgi:hypothetical protein
MPRALILINCNKNCCISRYSSSGKKPFGWLYKKMLLNLLTWFRYVLEVGKFAANQHNPVESYSWKELTVWLVKSYSETHLKRNSLRAWIRRMRKWNQSESDTKLKGNVNRQTDRLNSFVVVVSTTGWSTYRGPYSSSQRKKFQRGI